MNSIEVRGLCSNFGNFQEFSLQNVNLSLKKSSIYCLIGPSGSGKTTLLSCILAMKSFTSGSISVLGSEDVSKVSHRIGFMPQHVELVPKLTVAENLSFFGNIHHLEKRKLKSQLAMLSDLLELNFQNSQVTDLSGGEKRRVALAVALIHDPQLLILDEPTVGLDVLLRAKIWDFLQTATKNRQMSVLVTTHYIFEAQFAHRCAFIRNGVILAQNSPEKIVESLQVNDLDEAFVKLCKTDNKHEAIEAIEENSKTTLIDEEESNYYTLEAENIQNRPSFTFQRFVALFMKEIHRFKRTSSEIFLLLSFSICLVLSTLFFMGAHPKGLKMGILNLETENCVNFSNICDSEFRSCNFVDELRNKNYSFVLKNFKTFEEGHFELKSGKITGFLVLANNFTKVSFLYNKKPRRKSDVIDVHLDQSDFIIFKHVKESIMQSFMNFNEKLGYCRQKKPIVALRREDLYGTLSTDMQPTMIGYILMGGSVNMFTMISSLSISSARSEGAWNLTLLAGVNSYEIFLANFVFSLIQCTIMIFETLFSIWLLYPNFGGYDNFWIIFWLHFELAISCILFEYWLSCMTRNFTAIFYINLELNWIMMTISGLEWPIEGQPKILQWITKSISVARASAAVNYILHKDAGISNSIVQQGFISMIPWILILGLACLWVMRKPEFIEKKNL